MIGSQEFMKNIDSENFIDFMFKFTEEVNWVTELKYYKVIWENRLVYGIIIKDWNYLWDS